MRRYVISFSLWTIIISVLIYLMINDYPVIIKFTNRMITLEMRSSIPVSPAVTSIPYSSKTGKSVDSSIDTSSVDSSSTDVVVDPVAVSAE